ncbi:hypothetical protein BG846_05367 [Streptomyces fradiae ATCC 10745 = DSM 40063]|uniref:Uncharacterized protein n=1 Tax=Streptomyces fradiae ATCC 10745 = DSM 40063 TaxID=1319510 RepID=A0A1Y2NND9_STRFR|nr:hypothetical protein BG846_05367 [Streptomyces fradiae ATCC 10745 = DSM 40063]
MTPKSRMTSASSSPASLSRDGVTSAAPLRRDAALSKTAASKLGEENCRVRESGVIRIRSRRVRASSATPRWLTTTPLGRPVDPEV